MLANRPLIRVSDSSVRKSQKPDFRDAMVVGCKLHLQGLLVLEMINEFVPAGIHHDGRDHYRRMFFSKTESFDSLKHPEVDLAALADVRTRILAYREETGIDLSTLLGPFVLPAVKAVSNRDADQAKDPS